MQKRILPGKMQVCRPVRKRGKRSDGEDMVCNVAILAKPQEESSQTASEAEAVHFGLVCDPVAGLAQAACAKQSAMGLIGR